MAEKAERRYRWHGQGRRVALAILAAIALAAQNAEVPRIRLQGYPAQGRVLPYWDLAAPRAATQGVRLNWTLGGPAEGVKAIRVYRRVGTRDPAGQAMDVVRELGPSLRTFVDAVERGEHVLSYAVAGVGPLGEENRSASRTVLVFAGNQMPPVRGLRAEFHWAEGDTPSYVELSWHPPAETKELANYAIISDLSRQGNMLEMASLPFSKETSRRIPIQGDGGRRMTFRVVPRDRRGVYGEAREVSVDIPPLRIHAPSGFAGKVNPDSSVTLRWTYPEDWPVDGFRIKLAGKQIAGEDVLAADARSHTVPYAALGGKRIPRFKIAAVKGPVQSMEVGYAGLLVKPPPPEDIPVVENLKARLLMKDGRPAAEISWTN